MSTWKSVCKECGLDRWAHHEFDPAMPPGCVCSPKEWSIEGMSVPCKAFVEQPNKTYCARCEHDKECHRSQ